MKENFVKIVFVVDESGSMYSVKDEIISGFNKFIDKQKELNVGEINVSLYKFSNNVSEIFTNKDINDVEKLSGKLYSPGGMTALYDGVGRAIDDAGKELAEMEEKDRPSKVIVVVMTDGAENSSNEYCVSDIRSKIEEQESKYSWEFIYLGANLTNAKEAKNLGFSNTAFFSYKDTSNTYSGISDVVSCYRSADAKMAKSKLTATMDFMTTNYEKERNIKVKNRD